jgi:hypothetical protein
MGGHSDLIGEIYFVREGDDGAIKIGWTAGSALERRAACQTGNPRDLHLLPQRIGATLRGEAELHAYFAPHRIRAEWFKPVPELVALAHGRVPADLRNMIVRTTAAIEAQAETVVL